MICFIIWVALRYLNMYLYTGEGAPQAQKAIAAPNRDDGATLGDGLSDLERLLDLALIAGSNRLLDEHGNTREVLLDLYLDITALLEGAPEHGGRADDKGTGTLLWRHALDEIVKRFVNASIAVGRDDERVALFLEDGSGALCRGVDEGDDLEAQAELAERE